MTNSVLSKASLLRTTAPVVLMAAAIAAGASSPSFAQATSNDAVNANASSLAEVVVTARKKSENLLDVPLAINALPAADLEKKHIVSLAQVGDFTPSLNIASFGSSISNRAQQSIIIRGFTPASQIGATTTVFVNGAPLSSQGGAAGLIDGIGDLAQVEIIKGPQAAYFGRSTFAGAVNLVTKRPTNDYRASVDALYGSYNWKELTGSVEGPIVKDILKARVTARYYDTDGQYDNHGNGGKLGAQNSKNISGELNFTPFEGLEVRAFGMYIKTDDQPNAMMKFKASDFNCNTSANQRFLCGTAPQLPLSRLGLNTNLPPALLDWFNSRPLSYKNIGLDHMGAAVETKIGNFIVNYDLPYKIQFTSVTSGQQTYAQSINDLSNEYNTAPNKLEPFETYNYNAAFSQEFRLTSDQSQRLRGAVGVNYYYTHYGQWNGGSILGTGFLDFGASSTGQDRTVGAFASAAFDFTSQWTLNLEGRWQKDRGIGLLRRLVNGSVREDKQPGLSYDVNQFLPRVILQYKFLPGQQIYATYSKGTNPGVFNAGVLNYNVATQQYLKSISGSGLQSEPEQLENYEVGYKGSLFNNRLQIDVDYYRAHWTKQLVLQSFYIQNQALTGSPATIVIGAYSNSGDTDLQGFEGNIFWQATDDLSVSVGGSINDSKVNTYAASAPAALLGAPLPPPLNLFAGAELPNYSKYQANAAVDYSHPIQENLDLYLHGDYVHKAGQYESVGNFVKSPDTDRFNFRVGLERDKKKLEVFVDNAFNNLAYTSFTNQIDVVDGNRRIAYGAMPMPRRFGVRFHGSF